jgi:hypothetical protein
VTRKHERGRIYPGQLFLPGDRTVAHREFFGAIKRKAPAVLQSLHDEILPDFIANWDSYCPNAMILGDKAIFGIQDSGPENQGNNERKPDFRRRLLYALLWDWAARHHLVTGDRFVPAVETCPGLNEEEFQKRVDAFWSSSEATFFVPWAWYALVQTLTEWRSADPRSADLDWTMPYRPYPIKADDCAILWASMQRSDFELSDLFTAPNQYTGTFQFNTSGWNPSQETRAEGKKRILAELTQELDRKLDRTEQDMKVFGLCPTPAKLNTEHFDWLVLYQVCEQNFARIGKDHDRDAQSVADGVKDAAELVIGPASERWLRPPRPGRPAGS